jgi:long-subunit fatty acid transport protein
LPELSIVGSGSYRSEDNTFAGHPESNKSQSVSQVDLNYLSGAYPFALFGKNMTVAVTYQHLYDFNRSWQFPYNFRDQDLSFDMAVDYDQDGGLSAWGLSYAVQILDSLSAGLTLNIWDDGIGLNNWTQDTRLSGSGQMGTIPLHEVYSKLDDYEFQGINCNIGFLWRINEAITLGGVYKTAFSGDISHRETLYEEITSSQDPGNPLWHAESNNNYDEDLDMPASYGIGISYRFSDNLSVAFDLYRTEWDDMIYTDHLGNKTSAISGVSEQASDIDPTTQIRTGLEYLFITETAIIPVRAGLFYDPAPSEGGSDDFYGITLGSGYARGPFAFDAGYQFRFGNNVGSAIYKTGNLEQDVREHILYTSLIFHF